MYAEEDKHNLKSGCLTKFISPTISSSQKNSDFLPLDSSMLHGRLTQRPHQRWIQARVCNSDQWDVGSSRKVSLVWYRKFKEEVGLCCLWRSCMDVIAVKSMMLGILVPSWSQFGDEVHNWKREEPWEQQRNKAGGPLYYPRSLSYQRDSLLHWLGEQI